MNGTSASAAGLPWPLSHDFGMQSYWDDATSGSSDFHLYCLTFPILVVGYTLGCLPFLALDLSRSRSLEAHKLQRRTYSVGDVVRCYLKTQAVMWSVIGPIQLLSYPFFQIAGISSKTPLPSWWQFALQIMTFFIVEDYLNYWIHRWLHTPWAYKHIHYLHHEYDTPMSASASFAHPLEGELRAPRGPAQLGRSRPVPRKELPYSISP